MSPIKQGSLLPTSRAFLPSPLALTAAVIKVQSQLRKSSIDGNEVPFFSEEKDGRELIHKTHF